MHLQVHFEDGMNYGILTLGSNTMAKGAVVVCISRLLGPKLSLVSCNLDVAEHIKSHLWLTKRTPSISWHSVAWFTMYNARNHKTPWTHEEYWVVVTFHFHFFGFLAYPKDTEFLIQFTQERAGDKVWQIQVPIYYYAIWLHVSVHATIQYATIKQMRY